MARNEIPVISYSCDVSRKRDGEQSVQDHSLTFVIQGSYELDNGFGKVVFSSGDIFFCAKNQLLKYRKLNQSEKDFKSLTIFLMSIPCSTTARDITPKPLVKHIRKRRHSAYRP